MTTEEKSSPNYIDPVSGLRYPIHTPLWRSAAGHPLRLSELAGINRAQVRSNVRSLWRYAAAMPLEVRDPITLGEGCTPLVCREWGALPAHFKLEWFSPTGSFKDRGASVMLSILRQQGIDAVLEDSSGNGGAAVAAYAAAGGMQANILVPAATQPEKIVQIREYGATVDLVDGSRQHVADVAQRSSDRIFYASHNWQAFFLHGTKTLAYELWEDLAFSAPDNIVVPLGAGSLVLGCSIAFKELQRAGSIERLPRIFGVQPLNCAPIHCRFTHPGGDPSPLTIAPTVAEGAAIERPIRGDEVVSALRDCGGRTIAVSEEEIVQALHDLGRIGFYVEPTAAMSGAGLTILLREREIAPSDRTVVVLTGGGLKATQRILQIQGL